MHKFKEKRKNERIKIKIKTNQSLFLNAIIEYIEEHQHAASEYFLTEKHYIEYNNIFGQKSNKSPLLPENNIKDKEIVIILRSS